MPLRRVAPVRSSQFYRDERAGVASRQLRIDTSPISCSRVRSFCSPVRASKINSLQALEVRSWLDHDRAAPYIDSIDCNGYDSPSTGSGQAFGNRALTFLFRLRRMRGCSRAKLDIPHASRRQFPSESGAMGFPA